MMASTTFGDPARFAITVRWTNDREPRARRPAHGGWSTGELQLTVGGHVLTRHEHAGKAGEAVKWYLQPVFEWLADHWIELLHEEHFAWRENGAAPAATAAFLALRRLIDADDEVGHKLYAEAQAWWSRHALRAADSSALYPDVFFRRLGDRHRDFLDRSPADPRARWLPLRPHPRRSDALGSRCCRAALGGARVVCEHGEGYERRRSNIVNCTGTTYCKIFTITCSRFGSAVSDRKAFFSCSFRT